MSVRVRFAPSPTGNVHIGNIRVAIFNWLYAKNKNGKFLLRIEDTDLERSTPEAIKNLLSAIKWLGIDYDDEAMYQSKQIEIHKNAAEKMIEMGYASRTTNGPVVLHLDSKLFDKKFVTEPKEIATIDVSKGQVYITERGINYITKSSEGKEFQNQISWDALSDLEVITEENNVINIKKYENITVDENLQNIINEKPKTLRFKRRYVYFDDLILGKLQKPLDSLKDLVIIRSDGSPVFHLANVVDDIQQNVSHIIRGNDHIENTYRHLFIYKALGINPPNYAHLPMIVNSKGKPYSKRDGDAYVGDFKDKGYLPECLFNFLALCGWGRDNDQEIMTKMEMIENFSLEKVSASAAQLNLEKLEWMNGQYLIKMPIEKLVPLIKEELMLAGITINEIPEEWLKKLIALEQERLKTVKDFVKNTTYFFTDKVKLDEKAIEKVLRKDNNKALKVLADLKKILVNSEWIANDIEKNVVEFGEKNQLKFAELAQPLRVAITGTTVSRGIWETMELLGKNKTIQRINDVLEQVKE